MTIDERIDALTQSVELLTHDVQAMQEQQKRILEREARFRRALLEGMRGAK